MSWARRRRVDPHAFGWQAGRAVHSRQDLWVPYDQPTLVLGATGSGKSLDLLLPALMGHHGSAIATMTKLNDLLLILGPRSDPAPGSTVPRPVLVLDPFGLAPGTEPLTMDIVAGCADAMLAERRAMAFAAGTIGAGALQFGDAAARFYAVQAGTVIKAYLHAAGLTGRTLEHVMVWVAEPSRASEAVHILETHPMAAYGWDGLLRSAIGGSDDTAANTLTTVYQAFGLFFQPSIRARCVPGPGRPATDVAQVIVAGGTIVLLGREDPYTGVAPLMTAVAEHVLDTARTLAAASPYPRLVPPLLACLDELPSTAPVPTLPTSLANDRDLGISYLLAAQNPRQLVVCYGPEQASTLRELANNWIIFGGSKDTRFNDDISDLLGTYWADRGHGERQYRVMPPEQIRMLPTGQALILAGRAPAVIAQLDRCITGPGGRALLARADAARHQVAAAREQVLTSAELTQQAHARAARRNLTPGQDYAPRDQDGSRA